MHMQDETRQCSAATKDLSLPGRLRCANNAGKKRADGLCTTHGKHRDRGIPVTQALPHAPTLNQIRQHWDSLKITERRKAMEQSAAQFPKLGMSDHQLCSWLMAWYRKYPESEPSQD